MRHDFWRQLNFFGANLGGFHWRESNSRQNERGKSMELDFEARSATFEETYWMHFHGFFQRARKKWFGNSMNNVWNIFVLGLVFVQNERNWDGVPLFVRSLLQVANFLTETRREGRGIMFTCMEHWPPTIACRCLLTR